MENASRANDAIKSIVKPGDLAAFRELLRNASLPFQDLQPENSLLAGYFEKDVLLASGALEFYGDWALLRSLSVRADARGKSIGSQMTDYLLKEAKKMNLRGVFLLTETASAFFEQQGFETVSRDEVPAAIKASSEFSHVCPASATVMSFGL